MERLAEAARSVLQSHLGLQPGERVLIVCDESTARVGQALFMASQSAEARPFLLQVPSVCIGTGSLPSVVVDALVKPDVVVCATSRSMTHADAVKKAYENGKRVASMPGITERILIRTLRAETEATANLSRKMSRVLDEGKRVLITSRAGTHLEFSIAGRKSIADCGLLRERGSIGNIPAGEAFIAPVEGTAEGTLVVDGSIALIGKVQSPVTIRIERGAATTIQGGSEAERLLRTMKDHGEKARQVAEFGIGANGAARISGTPLEDEKVLGTAHIAFGKNTGFGGAVDADIHVDCIVKKPVIFIDGSVIVRHGKWLLR